MSGMAENGLCVTERPKMDENPLLAKPEIVAVTELEHV